VAPTGAGKTVMFSHLIRDEFIEFPDTRAVVLVHRDELADQALDKIHQVAPGLRAGKVKADSNDVTADVVVASVQTLAVGSRLDQLKATEQEHGPLALVVVDECHHAVAPSWRRVLDALGCFNPESGAHVVGFSATLARGDGIGLGSVWQEVAYAISLTRLIRRGHLADVRGIQVKVEDLDLSGVRRSGGDYQAGALGAAIDESAAPETIAKAYLEHAADRPGMVFAPTVDTAVAIDNALNGAGIVTATVTGETPREERQLIYKRSREGDVQVLANCMVLTEGFDAPWISCAVIARPTQSAPLYTQMVGRVLRPWPGKVDALVLDVVGASSNHKLATLIDLQPGAVSTIREDQTLTEAIEEAELDALRDEQEREAYARQSRLTAKLVDLFAQSRSVWLRTEAGVWFIPTRDGEVFLWPADARGGEPGTWDVAHAPTDGHKALPWQRLHEGLGIDLAMSWAQAEAEERDPSVATKDASWRTRGGKASEGQIKFLRSFKHLLGGREPEELRKAEASDIISVGLASRKFDRHYRKVNG
jgi:superfamily II DNA or RNA helicase